MHLRFCMYLLWEHLRCGALIKNQFINNLQTPPIISILILPIFFGASCTVRGGTYFAATGYMGTSTAGGGGLTQIGGVFSRIQQLLYRASPCVLPCPNFNGMLLENPVESLY